MQDHDYSPRWGDTWCRYCNSEPGEAPHDDVCFDCAMVRTTDDDPDRDACSNCDRVFPLACSREDDPTEHDAWSRDRDDHDAAVNHFIGRVSPWVRSALAGTLAPKALA